MAGPGQCVGFAILGDLMLGRHVTALIEREGVAALLSDVRAAAAGRPLVANLESPLCDQVPAVADGVLRFAAPTNLARDLRAQGVAAVSLANNHVLDYGRRWTSADDHCAGPCGHRPYGGWSIASRGDCTGDPKGWRPSYRHPWVQLHSGSDGHPAWRGFALRRRRWMRPSPESARPSISSWPCRMRASSCFSTPCRATSVSIDA